MPDASLVPRSVDFDEVWRNKCENQLASLFQDEKVSKPVSAASLYNSIYHLSVAIPKDYLLEVYKRIGKLFSDEAFRLRGEIFSKFHETGSLLESYANCWRIYKRAVQRIDSLCMYVNKVIEKLTNESLPDKTTIVIVNGERMELKVKNVGAMGLGIWKYCVLHFIKEKMDNGLVKELLREIGRVRVSSSSHGRSTNFENISLSAKSFYECDPIEYKSISDEPSLYETEVEAPFLMETAAFFTEQASRVIESNKVTLYVHYAESTLLAEIEFARRVFPIASLEKIVSLLERTLILDHTDRLGHEFTALLDQNLIEELGLVFRLLQRIPDGILPLAQCFENWIIKKGEQNLSLLTDLSIIELSGKYVELFGSLYHEVNKLCSFTFGDHEIFKNSLSNGFKHLLTIQIPNSPIDTGVILAKFIDSFLQQKLPPSKDHNEVQFLISDTLELTQFLGNVDSFLKQYFQDVSCRILFRLSHDGQAEGLILQKFAEGNCQQLREASVRLRKMLTDIHYSHLLNTQFLKENPSFIPYEVLVNVPAYIVWPLETQMDPNDPSVTLPKELLPVIDQYTRFYRRAWPNRHLVWLHNLSRVVIRHCDVNGKHCDITVTIPQANLLLLFKERESVLISDSLNTLNVTLSDFHTIINPIISAGILHISDNEQVINYNSNWSHHKSRLCLCQFTLGRSVPIQEESLTSTGLSNSMDIDSEEISGNWTENRKYLLQCLIVKQLKRHKELSPARLFQLVNQEVSSNSTVSFIPTPNHIQSTIEVLMDKQYLDYDKRRDLYLYIP